MLRTLVLTRHERMGSGAAAGVFQNNEDTIKQKVCRRDVFLSVGLEYGGGGGGGGGGAAAAAAGTSLGRRVISRYIHTSVSQ